MSKLDIQELIDRGASPSEIAEELEGKGITRYLFNIDSVGQFNSYWSVFVHSSEEHLLDDVVEDECEDCSHCSKGECSDPPTSTMRSEGIVIVGNLNDHPCKCCGTGLNAGETPCWKCGTDNPTILKD